MMSNPPAVRPPARTNRKGLERMSPPGKRSRVGTWGRVKGTRRRAGGREGREEREDGKTGRREDGRTGRRKDRRGVLVLPTSAPATRARSNVFWRRMGTCLRPTGVRRGD